MIMSLLKKLLKQPLDQKLKVNKTLKNSDFQFKVDINKNVESLNISNTVAIVCHHINHILKKKN